MGAVTLTDRPAGFLPRGPCTGGRLRTARRHDPAGSGSIAPTDGMAPAGPVTRHGRLRHRRTPAVIQMTAADHQAAHRNWARRPQPQDETRRPSRFPS